MHFVVTHDKCSICFEIVSVGILQDLDLRVDVLDEVEVVPPLP
jgi:hypothetical protein